jgi:hypothetical protein
MGAALAATLIVAAIALFGSRLLQHAARNFDFFVTIALGTFAIAGWQ